MQSFDNKFLFLILKEKKLILFSLICSFVLFVIYSLFFYTPLYSTKGTIFVKNIVKQDVVAAYDSGGSVISESGYSNPLFNLDEILKAQNIVYGTYKTIKNKYPEDLISLGVNSKEAFYEVYPKLIKSSVEPSTDIIKITLLWPNRQNAPKVLNEVINEFKKENLFIKKAVETKKRIFLDNQTNEIASKLGNIRKKIRDYKIHSGVSNIESETTDLIQAKVDLEKQASILNSQINYNNMKLKEFAEQLNITDPKIALRATGIGTDPYLIKSSQDLAILQQEYAKNRAKYTDKYPDLISIKNQIKSLQNSITKREAETCKNVKIPRAIYDGPSSQIVTNFALTQAELVSMKEQLITLNQGVESMSNKEAQLPIKQLGLDDLKKQEDAFASAYQNIKEKELEAKIKESEIVDNLILLNASTKAQPLFIAILTRFLGFIMLGAIAGLGMAYVKEGFENKWSSIRELQFVTGQDILGTIPWLNDFDTQKAKMILEAAYANISSEIISKAYLKESFVISFISTNKNKNKSLITDYIAANFIKRDRSVALIDLVDNKFEGADLIDIINSLNREIRFKDYEVRFRNYGQRNEKSRSPKSSHPQDVENEDDNKRENFVEYDNIKELLNKLLSENMQKIKIDFGNDEQGDLYKLQINKKNIKLNDYIATKGFSLLLKYLKDNFEFVLINAPHGLMLLPEIKTINKVADATVIISSINTNRDALINVVDNIIKSEGQKILGIITREENSELEKHIDLLDEM